MKKHRLFYIPVFIVIALIMLDAWRDGAKDKKADQAKQQQIEVEK